MWKNYYEFQLLNYTILFYLKVKKNINILLHHQLSIAIYVSHFMSSYHFSIPVKRYYD